MTKAQRQDMNKIIKGLREDTKMKIDEIKNELLYLRQEIKNHKEECKRLKQKVDKDFVEGRKFNMEMLRNEKKEIENQLKRSIVSVKNSFNMMDSMSA